MFNHSTIAQFCFFVMYSVVFAATMSAQGIFRNIQQENAVNQGYNQYQTVQNGDEKENVKSVSHITNTIKSLKKCSATLSYIVCIFYNFRNVRNIDSNPISL